MGAKNCIETTKKVNVHKLNIEFQKSRVIRTRINAATNNTRGCAAQTSNTDRTPSRLDPTSFIILPNASRAHI